MYGFLLAIVVLKTNLCLLCYYWYSFVTLNFGYSPVSVQKKDFNRIGTWKWRRWDGRKFFGRIQWRWLCPNQSRFVQFETRVVPCRAVSATDERLRAVKIEHSDCAVDSVGKGWQIMTFPIVFLVENFYAYHSKKLRHLKMIFFHT